MGRGDCPGKQGAARKKVRKMDPAAGDDQAGIWNGFIEGCRMNFTMFAASEPDGRFCMWLFVTRAQSEQKLSAPVLRSEAR